MNHEDTQVVSNQRDGGHDHGPRKEEKHGRLGRLWKGDHDWLNQSWEEAEAFLDCEECVPHLTDTQRQTLRVRWLREAQHYDQLWRAHRLRDDIFRVLIVIGAATVPVLAGLEANRWVIATVSLAVAILASLDGLFQLRERWRKLRETATLMTREGWLFLELSDPYHTSHETAYRPFLAKLEALNATQTEEYLRTYTTTPQPSDPQEPKSTGGQG